MSLLAQGEPTSTAIAHATGLAAFSTAVVGVFGFIPIAITVFAGLMAGISYTLTVLDHPRIKLYFAQRRARRDAAKLARLRAKQKIVLAEIDALSRIQTVKDVEHAKVQAVKDAIAESIKTETQADKP